MNKRKRMTYAEVKEEFEHAGCVLLSTTYSKSKDRLEYICECGNHSVICYDKFKIGQRCQACKKRKMKEIASKQRHSYDFIKETFEANGCKLLTKDYQNGKQKLKYVCECGTESEISFSKFKVGQRCYNCKITKIKKKLTGPANPHWDHSKSMEERLKDRKYPEYKEWRRKVYERDNYTCQCCMRRGGTINAHHLDSYAKNPDKRTDVNNGVTLCYECHKEYHQNVQSSATRDGWDYFTGEYRNPWYAGEMEREHA